MPDPDRADGIEEDSTYRQAEQDFLSAARAEAEVSGREAAELSTRSRSLADVAFEAMSRGDQLAAGIGERDFHGTVVHAAGNLMTLDVSGMLVDFNLDGPVRIQIVERVTAGGRVRGTGPGSFRGRLLELESAGHDLELGSPLCPGALRGRLRVTGQDHVVFEDGSGRDWFVPLTWIGYIATLGHSNSL